MGFLDSIKKGATKTKLQGEIVLLDREIASIKKEFGVTLYDLLSKGVDSNTTPALLTKTPEVATAFETFYKDIQDILREKTAKLKEIETYEAKKDTRLPATTTQVCIWRSAFLNFSLGCLDVFVSLNTHRVLLVFLFCVVLV